MSAESEQNGSGDDADGIGSETIHRENSIGKRFRLKHPCFLYGSEIWRSARNAAIIPDHERVTRDLFAIDKRIFECGDNALFIGAVNLSGGVHVEGALAGVRIFLRSGGEFECGVVTGGIGQDAVTEQVAVFFAGGHGGIDERGLFGGDLIFGSGAEDFERFRHGAEDAIVALDGFGKSAQVVYDRVFFGGSVRDGPLLRELRNIEKNEADGKQVPAAGFVDEAEIGVRAIDDANGNECEIFVNAGLPR